MVRARWLGQLWSQARFRGFAWLSWMSRRRATSQTNTRRGGRRVRPRRLSDAQLLSEAQFFGRSAAGWRLAGGGGRQLRGCFHAMAIRVWQPGRLCFGSLFCRSNAVRVALRGSVRRSAGFDRLTWRGSAVGLRGYLRDRHVKEILLLKRFLRCQPHRFGRRLLRYRDRHWRFFHRHRQIGVGRLRRLSGRKDGIAR